MSPSSFPFFRSRLGFHYFPDTNHYRENDLNAWLPELTNLRASSLTLVAPIGRAIPEYFIDGLKANGIQPVLHFKIPLIQNPDVHDYRLLFHVYARWGVRYVVLFDRPNLRRSWQASGWSRHSLVERFLDIFIPLAETALTAGLTPVFPPLEPGGDYWDTAFLRAALQGIHRRGSLMLQEKIALAAYAWADNRSLNWGAGGPERWPTARPYSSPPGVQDQRGFRIFDWYLALAQAIFGTTLPIILVAAGCRLGDHIDPENPPIDQQEHARRNLTIARLMSSSARQLDLTGLETVPVEVIACNFWLLAASPQSVYSRHAWFQPDGRHLEVVEAIQQWLSSSRKDQTTLKAQKLHPFLQPQNSIF